MIRNHLLLLLATLLYAVNLTYLAQGLTHHIIRASVFSMPGYAAIFIFYLSRLPSVRQKLLVLAAGAALEIAATLLVVSQGYSPLAGRGILLGLFTVALLGYRALKARGQDHATNRDLLWCMLLQAFLVLSNPFVDAASVGKATVDYQLYTFELALGIDIPALLYSLFKTYPWLSMLPKLVYMTPAAALMLAYAIERNNRPPADILVAFMLASGLAILYFVVPACGPRQVFGALFPDAMPTQNYASLMQNLDLSLTRNAMPSLHMSWALLLWFNAHYFYPKFYKYLFAFYGCMTVLATMGTGEHYFIDLVVALPLTVMAYAVTFRKLPFSHPARQRAIVFGAAIGAIWLVALMFAYTYFTLISAWAAIILTLLASLWLLKQLITAYKAYAVKY